MAKRLVRLVSFRIRFQWPSDRAHPKPQTRLKRDIRMVDEQSSYPTLMHPPKLSTEEDLALPPQNAIIYLSFTFGRFGTHCDEPMQVNNDAVMVVND